MEIFTSVWSRPLIGINLEDTFKIVHYIYFHNNSTAEFDSLQVIVICHQLGQNLEKKK